MLLSDNSIYLQKVLSSKLYEFAYKRLFSSIELGEKGYQYNKHALIKLPILKDPSAMAEIENCNDNNLLNIKLYELYTLTNDEITLIESYFLTTGTDET